MTETTLALNDGDLALEDGQLAWLTGTPALHQALTLRILTPLGGDRFNVAYGLDLRRALTQPVAAAAVRELIKLDLLRTISGDPRVAEVRDIEFRDSEDAQRRAWPVDVTLLEAGGGERTLELTVGA